MTDQWVDELFDETEKFMSFLRLHLKKLLSGATNYTPPPLAVNSAIPTISGTAVDGGTLTATQGTWSNSPTDYDRVWQIATDSPNFTQWSDIADSKALTYDVQVGDIDAKLRYGERALNLGGWSQWVYSAPSGIVIDSSPPVSAPTINAAGYFSDVGGGAIPSPLYVGDTIEIQEADVSDATGVWYYLVRDGVPVTIQPIATDQDTFPVAYAVNSEDIGTTFELQTVASNAAGQVTATSADIGPIAWPSGSELIDLGSAQNTEDFILAGFSNNWTPSGTQTETTITVTTPADLKTAWDNSIRTASATKRWVVELDWDGMLVYGAGPTVVLPLYGPTGATAWSDAGGWVKLVAASGKRPAIGNRIDARNWRGVHMDGIDVGGRFTTQNSGTASIWFVQNATYAGEAVFSAYNCRFGRKAFDATETESNYIRGFYSAATIEQLTLDTCSIAGTYCALNCPARRTKLYNCDISANLEDVIKSYIHTKTGYYAYFWVERTTIREQSRSQSTDRFHSDILQTGHASDKHLGTRVLFKDVVVHMDHKYATDSAGEGDTQGFLNNTHTLLDNLFCLRNNVFLITSPHGIDAASPLATHVSYIENTTFGRAGITPSQFDGTVTNKDFNNGIFSAPAPQKAGIAFKVNNNIYSFAASLSFVSYSGNILFNHKADLAGLKPEDVFNGADFERGGPAANNISNKFAYDLSQDTQDNFITAIIANWTPQGAYSAKGAPAPTPENYTAPAVA